MDARVKPGHDERERKKKSEAKRRQTQGRVLPRLAGAAAAHTLTLPRLRGREWEGAAHLSAFHRGSRPKESFIARDSAPGFCFLGRGGQGWPVRRAGVTRSYLSQSSEVIAPRS